MEYLVTFLVYFLSRWWLVLPTAVFVFYLLMVKLGWDSTRAGWIYFWIFLLLVGFVSYPRMFLAPVINHFGEYSIGTVQSKKATLFSDAKLNRIYSIRAEYPTGEGKTTKIRYWSISMRSYPGFASNYHTPTTPGEVFVVKYLPLAPKESVFLVEFSEKDRKVVCPKLNELADGIEREREATIAELKTLKGQVYQGLSSDEEINKMDRKIRLGRDLTPTEQRYKEVWERGNELFGTLHALKSRLIEHDNYCAE